MAWTIKELSCDAQTKHGCVITNKKNRILGIGYNSFPRDCDNDQLPNLRPDKYPWMVHSERNAITNCAVKPLDCGGGTAYVTGLCCFDCICHMWQNGINMIYQLDRGSEMLKGGNDEKLKDKLLGHVGKIRDKDSAIQSMEVLSIVTVKADFTFSLDIQAEARRLGLIHDEREREGRYFKDVG